MFVLQLGRPVRYLPYAGALPKTFDKIIVGWNGGREAARAVADAMPFLKRARQMRGVTIFEHKERDNDLPDVDIAAYNQGATMSKRILLIQGHPDVKHRHLCHALEDAYASGANLSGGNEIRHTHVAALDFPLLRSQHDWEHGVLPSSLEQAQTSIKWAEHIVFFFPIWFGDMPALLKGFIEQVARPGFAFSAEGENLFGHKALTGRTARVVVTMSMPALVYRWYFRAHSIKSLERNILGFVGIGPVQETLIGAVGKMDRETTRKWLAKLEKLGAHGA